MSDVALFIHSTGTGPFMWTPHLELTPPGMTTLTPPNRGYAPTDVLRGDECLGVGDDVAHLLAQLPDNTSGVHLLAHSYGAFVALSLALEIGLPVRSIWVYEPVMFGALRQDKVVHSQAVQAEVEALYAADNAMLDPANAGTDAWLERFIDYWSAPGAWTNMPDKAKHLTRAVSRKMFLEVQSISSEPKAFEHYTFDCPITLVYGSQTTSPAHAIVERLHTVNPHARIDRLDGLGHMGIIGPSQAVGASLSAHWQRVMA